MFAKAALVFTFTTSEIYVGDRGTVHDASWYYLPECLEGLLDVHFPYILLNILLVFSHGCICWFLTFG